MIVMYCIKNKTCIPCKQYFDKIIPLVAELYPYIKIRILDTSDNEGFDFANAHDVESVPAVFLNDGSSFFYPIYGISKDITREVDEYLERFK